VADLVPDGKRIAFTRFVGCGEDCAVPRIEIVSVDSEESADFENLALTPAWSPDGSEIAYVCSTWSICRKPVDGGPETVVWQGSRAKPAGSPSWRP
jgi:Tol biopolymer transport system component